MMSPYDVIDLCEREKERSLGVVGSVVFFFEVGGLPFLSSSGGQR